MKETSNLSDAVVYRLYAHNVIDNDMWATKNLRQHIKYWMENSFQFDVSCIAYIPISSLVVELERDLEKLKALKILDLPSQPFKSEIGSDVYGAGDYMDEIPAIDTLISYIENMLIILTNIKKSYGTDGVEVK